MGFGFGPGAEMMKDYERNRNKIKAKRQSLKDLQDNNIKNTSSKNNKLNRRPITYENSLVCPNCKTNFESKPDLCRSCGFPFKGTDKEKSVFIANQIMKKGKISDKKKRIKISRILLWVIGVFCMIYPLLSFRNTSEASFYFILYYTVALLFIAFGFLTYKIE